MSSMPALPDDLPFFETAVEQAYDSIVITEALLERPGPRIVYVNPAFTRMTGYSAGEAIGQTPRILQGPLTDRRVLDRLKRRLAAGERFEGEAVNYRKDGSTYVVNWHVAPIRDEEGETIYYIAIQRDVTDIREKERRLEQARELLEERVRARTRELAQANIELNASLRKEQEARDQLVQAGKLAAMGRMVASVAHELNNPLQTIKNCLFLLEDELHDGPAGEEYMHMALSEVKRLSDLVRELRDVYRPGNRQQPEPVDLPELLEEVRSLVKVHLRRHHVTWSAPDDPGKAVVEGFPDQLKQVFLNISLNAIEAMGGEEGSPGGGRGGTLTVAVHGEAERVGVSFHDTGKGLTAVELENLFDPFYTTKETGMGLGLAISYDIVRRHDGEIAVQSEPGVGSTFTVWLPVLAPLPPAARLPAGAAGQPEEEASP
ncbi:MAG: PAS domain S-box protein [Candidatus Promineifilaceae bacterium]|nr:PAS domain S-box protein [Candidatus Promineifilaceae bacterium]